MNTTLRIVLLLSFYLFLDFLTCLDGVCSPLEVQTLRLAPQRIVTTNPNGVQVKYSISEYSLSEDKAREGKYHVNILNFYDSDRPLEYAHPRRADHLILPPNATYTLHIDELEYIEIPYSLGFSVTPKLENEDDTDDNQTSSGYVSYPQTPVAITGITQYNGVAVVDLNVNGIMCNNNGENVKVLSKLTYSITCSKSVDKDYLRKKVSDSSNLRTLSLQPDLFDHMDGDLVDSDLEENRGNEGILIISIPEYKAEIDRFVEWKKLNGFTVYCSLNTSWTPQSILNTIKTIYNQDSQLEYILLVGDNLRIPAMYSKINGGNHVTDYYYRFVDGLYNAHPNFQIGRLPVHSVKEVRDVMEKIILMEKNPPSSPDYYDNYLLASYFQTLGNTSVKEDREYVTTTEKIFDYLQNFDKQIERIYSTNSTYIPTYLKSGELLKPELRVSSFNWHPQPSDILTSINNGKSLIIHRDHGNPSGWDNPLFEIPHLAGLTNYRKYPLMLSINCSSGDFKTTCFADRILSLENAGCSAILAASNYSYTKPNDTFVFGMVNSIWPSPGLLREEGESHPLTRIGDIMEKGLNYMSDVHPATSQYQREIFHIFGDPTMEFYPNNPQALHPIIKKDANNLTVINNFKADIVGININNDDVIPQFGVTNSSFPSDKSWKILLSKKLYRPVFIHYAPSETIKIQNEEIGGDRYYFGKNIEIGKDVDSSDRSGEVSVEYGALVIEASSLSIQSGFSVKKGSSLVITTVNDD